MWLTTMFHVGTGLPWDWRTGPSDSSERDHLRQMIDALPAGALVTADAGFVGYEILEALILESGRHLLIRVGANVRLLRNLGYVEEKNGLVYLWPDRRPSETNRRWSLRLVVAKAAEHPVYLVTSVLDEATLSDKQVVRDLRPSLGNRTVLSPLQANLRASQAAEPFGGQRRVGSDLVAAGPCGRWPCTLKWNWRPKVSRRADQRGQSVAGVSEIAPRIQEPSPTPGNRCATSCPRP